jgi:hypothetical protein
MRNIAPGTISAVRGKKTDRVSAPITAMAKGVIMSAREPRPYGQENVRIIVCGKGVRADEIISWRIYSPDKRS